MTDLEIIPSILFLECFYTLDLSNGLFFSFDVGKQTVKMKPKDYIIGDIISDDGYPVVRSICFDGSNWNSFDLMYCQTIDDDAR